ncbi:MAG: hypothetical protein GX605_05245 [Chloroflexi bacterium]|nr:hypothetical protein [Chloroflexota bacterium]
MRASWQRAAAGVGLASLVALSVLWGAAQARGLQATTGPTAFSAAGWRAASPLHASQGSLAQGGPVGQSESPAARLELGFWPAAVRAQAGGAPTPPEPQLWLPLAMQGGR